jgi:hypothetical protein
LDGVDEDGGEYGISGVEVVVDALGVEHGSEVPGDVHLISAHGW